MRTVMKQIGAWMGAFVMGSVASVVAAQTSAVDDSSKTPTRKVAPQDVQNMPIPQVKPGIQSDDYFKHFKRSDNAGGVAAQSSKTVAPAVAETPERAVSVVNQPVQMKNKPSQGGSVAKQVGPSAQGLKEIIAGIDNDSGSGSQNTINPNIQGSFAINPTGIVWTFWADVVLPASAWKVSCANRTSFFNNALGQAVSDDVVTTSPATVVMLGGKATVTCTYKTNAHLLNIAKRVEATAFPTIRNFSMGNVIYDSSSISLASKVCTRVSKTDNFVCS